MYIPYFKLYLLSEEKSCSGYLYKLMIVNTFLNQFFLLLKLNYGLYYLKEEDIVCARARRSTLLTKLTSELVTVHRLVSYFSSFA